MIFSDRITRMAPSATNAMATKAKEMKARGESVVSFTREKRTSTPPRGVRYAFRHERTGRLTTRSPEVFRN